MFGFRRKRESRPPAVDWPVLHQQLCDAGDHAAIEQSYPVAARHSFLGLLHEIDPAAASEILSAGNRLHRAKELIENPVVAVAGMLNSGKTSLVAGFLSPQGRARTLRGVAHAQGTHRFVLWLPEKWQADTELWELLLGRLGEALGSPAELLAGDPSTAHAQYNNREASDGAISIPLVATDRGLNDVGLGLLDCPDIVSDESLGLGAPALRRELLGRAATLCSAFLVVASAEQARDATLSDLMRIASDLMPGIPRLLAVNKARPREMTPEQVHAAFAPLAKQYSVETVYVAYDFDIPASRPYMPPPTADDATGDPLPVFYSVSPRPEENPPNPIAEDRMLAALPGQLDRGELFKRFSSALENNLRSAVWDRGRTAITGYIEELQRQTASARRCLMEVALEVFSRTDEQGRIIELRLHQNERIIRQLTEAFVETAPWYARWSVRMNAWFRRIVGGTGDRLRRWLPSESVRSAAEEVRGRLRRGEQGGLLTPELLRSLIFRHMEAHPLEHWTDDSPWEEACRTAILRYEQDDFTRLDQRQLEQACAEMWAKVSVLQKGTAVAAPLVMMVTTFGAVLMIPFDMGTAVIASASISELLAASGLTAITSIWAGGKNAAQVEQQAARQQLADLIAVLCDTFGVARDDSLPALRVGPATVQLPPSVITRREPVGPTIRCLRRSEAFEAEIGRVKGEG